MQNKCNLSKSWKIIKEVINKNKINVKPDKIIINNEPVTDNLHIANHFNDFYVNIGHDLSRDIPNIRNDPTGYIPANLKYSMFVSPVTQIEILNVISNLKESSAGHDEIPSKLLKRTCHLLIEPLLHVINLSLLNGVFPDELKIAQVLPLFKSGDKSIINNYRPVSILSVFSKIFEHIMYNRLLSFLNTHKVLYELQFGFREKHGTNIAFKTFLVDKILKSWENGEIVLGLFLDFSKAFDTVNREILISKLYKYGIRFITLNWFKSYLPNRKQYVSYHYIKSNEFNITCGIPQGSIFTTPAVFNLCK